MRVFISDLNGYVGSALRTVLAASEDEVTVVGTIEEGQTPPAKAKDVLPIGSGDVAELARSADAVVLDITNTTADTSLIIDGFRTGRYTEQDKVIVAVSSALTWSATNKPRDGGDFSESSFKRRKPTPRFSDTKTLESHILSLSRDSLRAHVVGCGIFYGSGEQDLHFLFKDAWLCDVAALKLPSLEGRPGSNVLPMVHVSDACQIVAKLFAEDPGKPYLVAVDNAKSTLAEVTAAISSALGPGAVEPMSPADADAALLANPSFELLQADLAFDTDSLTAAELGIEWTAQEGLVESISAVVAEFVKERRLTPIRTALLGPPGSGKSHFASLLGTKYYLPVVRTGDAVALALGHASPEVKAAIGPLSFPEGLTERVTEVIEGGSRLSAALVARTIRSVLSARRLRNRGFVLDGFPRTYAEAKALCAELEEDAPLEPEEGEAPEEGAEEEADESEVTVDPTVTPTSIVFLDGTDEALRKRVLAMSESEVTGTHNSEEGFTRRLHQYREANKSDGLRTPAVFFEDKASLEVMELKVDDSTDAEAAVDSMIAPYVEKGGTPYNYHPTPEEIALAEATAKAEADSKVAAEERAAKVEADRENMAREAREAEEKQRAIEVAKQEAALLEARSAPLRKYLVANVIPTLTQGLLDIAKIKPEDPVDYLAEFLFKQSPPEGE